MWQEADFKLSFNIVLCVGLPGAGLAWIHGAIREGLQSHSLASWRPHFSERAPDHGASQLCRWEGQKYNHVGAPELFLSSLCLFNFYISATIRNIGEIHVFPAWVSLGLLIKAWLSFCAFVFDFFSLSHYFFTKSCTFFIVLLCGKCRSHTLLLCVLFLPNPIENSWVFQHGI